MLLKALTTCPLWKTKVSAHAFTKLINWKTLENSWHDILENIIATNWGYIKVTCLIWFKLLY